METNKLILTAFCEGGESVRYYETVTAGNIHEIEGWITNSDDNRGTSL